MNITLSNVGDCPRVIYNANGRMVLIPVGATKTTEVADAYYKKLSAAHKNGDTLRVSVGGAVAAAPAGGEGVELPADNALSPLTVLANIKNYDYHELLRAVNEVVPDNQLGQRPAINEMIECLKRAAAGEPEPAAEGEGEGEGETETETEVVKAQADASTHQRQSASPRSRRNKNRRR